MRINRRKKKIGKVIKINGVTLTVLVSRRLSHPKYKKQITKKKKFLVHNCSNVNFNLGDFVQIMESRPISKTKKWIIINNIDNVTKRI